MITAVSYFTTTEGKKGHNSILLHMTSHQIRSMSSMTGITSGAEHQGCAQVFSDVVQSLMYCFVNQCLPFCPFSFSHFIVF